MALRWVFTCLLLWGLGCWTVWGETVPCKTTLAECRSTGSSPIFVNNKVSCCAPGYIMSKRNEHCSCTKKTNEVTTVPYTRGAEACDNNKVQSAIRDGQGNTVCCPPGFRTQNQAYTFNGHRFGSCTCTRPLLGRDSQHSGSSICAPSKPSSYDLENAFCLPKPVCGDKVSTGSSNGENPNILDVAEHLKKWSQKFYKSMRKEMKAMSRRMERMRTQMQWFFSNMLRG